MKILFIAPHPFYQDRGTPIDVHWAVTALSERGEEIDLLVYHEGEDRSYPNVKLHRVKPLFPVKNVSFGLSWKKILIDISLFFKSIKMVNQKKYDLIHAGEEAAFIALIIKWLWKIPYVYDMDSLMSRQIVNKHKNLKKAEKVLRFFESLAIKNAIGIAPVCAALEEDAIKMGGKNIISWKDISLKSDSSFDSNYFNIKEKFDVNGKILMYIGNLEVYQGIDLLLESFSIAAKEHDFSLFIIGGNQKNINLYKEKSKNLNIKEKVYFLGQHPANQISGFMSQADALVSPRISGHNTPMKIYSFLHSGVPVLATNLYTHTQVVRPDVAVLADADNDSFAKGIIEVLTNNELRQKISKEAVNFIEDEHTYANLKNSVDLLYNSIEKELNHIYE